MPISRPPKLWWDDCNKTVKVTRPRKKVSIKQAKKLICGSIWSKMPKAKKLRIRRNNEGFKK